MIRRLAALAVLCGIAGLALATRLALQPLPDRLDEPGGELVRAEVLDRHGQRLSRSYANRWNLHDRVALHEVPALLRDAFVVAEDRRFYEHGGVDWRARAAALWQNLRAGEVVSGGSTLTMQLARMADPAPRTLPAKLREAVRALQLERRFSKRGRGWGGNALLGGRSLGFER